MSIVATKKLLFLLADDQDRTYYVQGGVVKKNVMPYWLRQNPDGWKDMTLQFATNQKYFSTLRAFSTAIRFIDDGQQIIAERMLKGAGTEEVMYLIILVADPSKGLNYYGLQYKSRLDFSKFNGDPRKGIAMNTLQDDVFAMVQANESALYSIPCNSSNPKAIKVLFDGILLQDKLNFTGVDVNISVVDPNTQYAVPLTFTNNEGDSAGIISNSTSPDPFTNVYTYVNYPSNTNCPLITNRATTVTIKGLISMNVLNNTSIFCNIKAYKDTDTPTIGNARAPIFQGTIAKGITNVPVNFKIDLAPGEKLFILFNQAAHLLTPLQINWKSTSLSLIYASKVDPSIAYAIRPLDLLQQLVSKITNGKYTADSNFFRNINNRKVVLSGSSLRSFPDASIQTTFSDFFKSFTSAYNMGVTVRKGVLYIEPIEYIYNNSKELMNLGDISEVTLTVAEQFIYTSAKVGYVKQTYNKRNGRYETNCTHQYKFPIQTVLNQLDLVSPYRADPFGMDFIRTGYPDLQSTDDKGDSDVFTAMISDTVGQADGEISTAISFTVETLILATPVIKTPYSNTVVYNGNPTITGLAQPFKIITVYADGVIDGTAIVDGDGNWEYQVQTILESVSSTFNGVHTFQAVASTDPLNNSGFSNVLTLIVNTTIQSAFLITGPTNNDILYNNLPVISGIAPAGKVITLLLDAASIGTVVANSSGLWRFQTVAPIADGPHAITATAPLLPDAPAQSITVNKNVSSPLITSLSYGDIIYNNLPLIKGVAIAATVVPVYLDGGGGPIVGGVPGPMGTAVADANGDWSFQVVTVTDADGNVTPYIPEGLHIVSTTSTPINVLAAITGFRLMRGSNKGPVMDYDAIRLDDEFIPTGVDPSSLPPTLGQFLHPETLFNIEETTPLRMLRAHDNILNGFLCQQQGKEISFNGADVNANLVTSKNGVVFNEGADIPVNDLAPKLFVPFFMNFKAKVPLTFNEIMTSIDNDGYITVRFKGVDFYLLPIGTMNMKIATDEAQQFKLLVSGKTPLASLLQLFANGTTFNLGKNMIHLSDKNPLHFVKYNYVLPAEYHFADIYDDWQKNRFPRWRSYSPDYAQPWQFGDTIALQGISNGVGTAQVHMISAATAQIVDTFTFDTVPGSVVQLPNLLQELSVPLAAYAEGQYWFALVVAGVIIGIAEKIWLKADWPDTLKVKYGGSKDKIDYYFSTGIQPEIRVQGELLLWKAESEVDNYEDENGDFEITRGIPLKVRDVQFGSETSLISDWMSLKMNGITLLENVRFEGTHYTRNNNSKWEPEDLGKGIPELLVKIEMTLAENQGGVSFSAPGEDDINAVTWALDATAFGRNEGVFNVTTQNE